MYENLIGKSLSYAIRNIENDTIKICTEYGSNFWYVGSREAFRAKMPRLTKKMALKFRPTYEVREFVKPSRRIVLDVFDASPIVDNSTIIYIEGNEVGNMWFVGEKPEMEDGNNILNPPIRIPEGYGRRWNRRRRMR